MELVPLTEMFDLTVLLLLYFFAGYMVASEEEPHELKPQLAIIMPTTKKSATETFECFFIFFNNYYITLIFNNIYMQMMASEPIIRHYKITNFSSDSQTFSDFL